MSKTPPQSAADPRDGEPYYIDSDCPDCGSELVLFEEPATDEVWHDEWTCPDCQDGIHMDWPQAEMDALMERAAEVRDMDPDDLHPL